VNHSCKKNNEIERRIQAYNRTAICGEPSKNKRIPLSARMLLFFRESYYLHPEIIN